MNAIVGLTQIATNEAEKNEVTSISLPKRRMDDVMRPIFE